jgi:hypothetical protein
MKIDEDSQIIAMAKAAKEDGDEEKGKDEGKEEGE